MEVILTSENFESVVLGSELPVLIDFWAGWCPPCMALSPIIEEIAEERDDILVCKANADEQPELCGAFGVSSIPALFLIKGGKIVSQDVGYHDKQYVLDWVDQSI